MLHRVALAGLLIAVGGGTAVAQPASAERDAILAVERQWNAAVAARDPQTIAKILRPEFVFIAANGSKLDREAMLAAASNPDFQIDPFDTIAPDVRLYGSTAVVIGRFEQTGRYKGQPFRMTYAYTDVYVKTAEGWQAVSAHASVVPPPKAK